MARVQYLIKVIDRIDLSLRFLPIIWAESKCMQDLTQVFVSVLNNFYVLYTNIENGVRMKLSILIIFVRN